VQSNESEIDGNDKQDEPNECDHPNILDSVWILGRLKLWYLRILVDRMVLSHEAPSYKFINKRRGHNEL
ncbi:hypothetical protein ACJX0J_035130, partial [Zea mays]